MQLRTLVHSEQRHNYASRQKTFHAFDRQKLNLTIEVNNNKRVTRVRLPDATASNVSTLSSPATDATDQDAPASAVCNYLFQKLQHNHHPEI